MGFKSQKVNVGFSLVNLKTLEQNILVFKYKSLFKWFAYLLHKILERHVDW